MMPLSSKTKSLIVLGEELIYHEYFGYRRHPHDGTFYLPNSFNEIVDIHGVPLATYVDEDTPIPGFVRHELSALWDDPQMIRMVQTLSEHVSLLQTPCSGTISIQDVRNEFYAGGGPGDMGTLGANCIGKPFGSIVYMSDFYCLSPIKHWYQVAVHGGFCEENTVRAQYYMPQQIAGVFNIELYGVPMFPWAGTPTMSAWSYGTEWRDEGERFLITSASMAYPNCTANMDVYDLYTVRWQQTGSTNAYD
jgi:hypothetical protein